MENRTDVKGEERPIMGSGGKIRSIYGKERRGKNEHTWGKRRGKYIYMGKRRGRKKNKNKILMGRKEWKNACGKENEGE